MEEERDTYNEKISEIEAETVDYLVNSPLYSTRNEITSKILIYIILRKEISQNLLKKLTGHSSGIISQELNNLVNAGMIIKKKIPGVRKKLYTFETLEKISITRIKNIMKVMVSWERELEKIRNEMVEKRNKLETLNGYHNILKVLDFYIPAMKAYEKFADKLEL